MSMATETSRPRETGRSRAAIAGVPIAFLAIWAAIYAVASILPAVPLVGGGTFGGQEFILAIAGILFGPIAGAVAATIGALIASFIGPATAYFGLFTFYPHLVGALTAGLLMRNTRNARLIVLAIFIVAILAWPLLPWFSAIGGFVYSKAAYWPMYLTGLLTLWASPWAVRQIRSMDPKRVPLGVAIIGWTSYMVNHVYISLGYSFLYPEGPEQWVFAFWSGIVPAQRILLTIVTTLIGAALVIGLYRAGIRFPAGTGSALEEPVDAA
jgi:uncharacterized membrane protein